jgi:dimethylhistidine N-methyltransferase
MSPTLLIDPSAARLTDRPDDVLAGLWRVPRTLPPKLFYDAVGSALFDAITRQPEYYLTRAETEILTMHAADIAETLRGRDRRALALVELGSGSSQKTRILLRALGHPMLYVPVDIASTVLAQSIRQLSKEFPALQITAVVADFTRSFSLPPQLAEMRAVVACLGSSLGNFEPEQAIAFLATLRTRLKVGDGLLLGLDLKKDPAVLHAAYNDAAGVTARFNLNVLARVNREWGAKFPLEAFSHYAFYNPSASRVEMHLVARSSLRVRLKSRILALIQGESIHTENSYKYSESEWRALGAAAGLRLNRVWFDTQRWFGLFYFSIM